MKRISLISLCPAILVIGCEGRTATEDVPPALEEIRPANATFTPGTGYKARPAWVRELRATLEEMSEEGLAIGVAEDPPADRVAWLVHDPELGAPNWIVSAAGNLPADRAALRAHIAYLRVEGRDSFTIGLTPEGTLIDEATGARIARPLFVTDEGANLPVPLDMAGREEWERARLPLIGPVRFRASR